MASDLIAELRRRGIRLRLAGDQIDVLAPAGSLSDELRDELRVRRDWLIEMLRRNAGFGTSTAIRPAPADRFEPFPLTDIQHAYWVGRQPSVELGGVSCHFYLELERADLDPVRLTESFRKVIARHDMLRAVITPDGRQQVLPSVPDYDIAVADLRSLPPLDRVRELERIKEEMGHQVRPADRWPLFEVRASLLGDGRVRVHVSLDLLIMDGSSLYRLFEQWRRWYEDPGWCPEPLELSYRDYVLAADALRDGDAYREAERYWTRRLDDLPAAPALPLATSPAQISTVKFTRRAAVVDAGRWNRIKDTARRHGVTPSAVLLAAFAAVLRRWTSQPDLTLNLTLFHRPDLHPEIGQLIGDFTSTTLLAVRSAPGDTFTGFTARLQRQLMEDMEHAEFSGVRVLRERARRLGSGPAAAMPVVFTSALALRTEHDPSDGMRFFGDLVDGISQTPQVWLDHQVSERDGELAFNWDAVEELFPHGLLDDMFTAYRAVLERLADHPEAWEAPGPGVALPGWQLRERRRANDTAADIPRDTLCGVVAARAAERPDAVAVVDAGGELSYAGLVSHARRLGRRLADLGAEPGMLAAIVLDKGRNQAIAALGVCLSGAAYLPIDVQWPAARRWQLLELGRVSLVVTTARLREELHWPPGVRLVALDDPEVLSASEDPLSSAASPDDLAYVIFTSGSTGQPKGVMIDHRGAVNTILDVNRRFRVGPGDRVLALSALSFDLSVWDIFGTLAAGGTVVMPGPEGAHDPAHWTGLVREHGVTVWNSVPALMQAWLDAGGPAAAAGQGPRLVLLSGDWIGVRLPDAIRACYPRAQVISLGGATEASIWSVHYRIGEVPPGWTRIPYGKPLANQTLHVYDAELRPCPIWTPGDIYIGGTGVAMGYWADPDRTAERFTVHPETGERLYRTGDLGRYLPGGDIDFLGRRDFQVKINGYRIELGEIAETLRGISGISDAAVTADTNPSTGRRQLVAYLVPSVGSASQDASGTRDDESGWVPLVAAGETAYQRRAAELATELHRYRDVWRAMERLCLPVMARTLAELGVFTSPSDIAGPEEIVRRCGIKPEYAGLVSQWLTTLVRASILDPAGPPRTCRAAAPLDPTALDSQVEREFAALAAVREHRALIDYVTGCARRQVELLTGRVSPLELLLPGGDWRVTEALYATNPVSRLQNLVAAHVVRKVAGRPRPAPLRVLEVGAGTGGTTATVLPALPDDRVRYRFTDVSTFFTERARRVFADYPFVEYGVLDVDRDPAAQGQPTGSADLIIGANVLHDAKDLPRTLTYLRGVLAPGGLLLLIEGTANSPLQMITVGFIEGFTHYEGQHRMPLLSAEEWRKYLEGVGFAEFAAIPESVPADGVMTQQVLLAQAPSDRAMLDTAAVREKLASLLPDYMVPQHYRILDRLPLSANGKVDRGALPAPWTWAVPDERVEPRTDLEQRLLEIWRQALSRDDFGVEDNFFELGGDSLHALRILSSLRDDFGLEENSDEGLEILFSSPTIAGLAAILAERGAA
jgi:pyochelin synthetase